MTAPKRIKIFGWMFAFSIATTLLGIGLGISLGFNDLARLLTIGGAVGWVTFGNLWYCVFAAPDGQE